MKDLFMVSDSKRLQMYFGYPTFMTCSKPIMRYDLQEPVITPQIQRAAGGCAQCYAPRCQNNYYSPFE